MGNNQPCKVVGIGIVKVQLADGSMKLLTEVRRVPDLKRNLLSLGMLDQAGCTFKGEGGALKVTKRNLLIFKGTRKHGLYRLQGNTILNSASLVSVSANVSTK